MSETLYECQSIIQQVEDRAAANDGELSEEDMQAIVVAQTSSMERLGGLVGYMKHLESWQATCKAEEARIAKRRKTAENRLSSIKKYLAPYIQITGKKTVGTHTLSLRKSQAVEVVEGFANTEYGKHVTTFKADKAKIKADLKAHPDLVILGASLVTRQNLQVK